MSNKKENRSKLLKVIDESIDIGIGFVKAQIIMFLINTVVITVGLLILDMSYWSVLIALGISFLDILPILGSGIVFIPWTIYSVYIGNNSVALGLVIIYIVLVVIRIIVEPLITGKKIGLPPLIAVAAAVIGVVFFGGVGIVVGPILAAVGTTVYRTLNLKK